MSPRLAGVDQRQHSFPRVSGDEPQMEADTDYLKWFSPRERG